MTTHLKILLGAIAVAVAALVGVFICTIVIDNINSRNRALERDRHALLSQMAIYRTERDESAASVEALTLSLNEFRALHDKDAEQIKQLGIRLRRAESYARSVTESTYSATLHIRDTIIVHDTIAIDNATGHTNIDTVRTFTHSDRWSTMRGIIWGDSIDYNLHSVDTLKQVVHRVPRRFLGIPYGTKAIRQEIVSSNPHTQLIYTEYIELKRRNKR